MISDRVRTAAATCIGAIWIVAAVAKLLRPEAAWEFAARTAPAGVPPRVILATVVGCEAALGVAMVVRAVRSGWPSLAGVVAFTAALLAARARVGPDLPCGCFGALLGATVGDALVRNATFALLHVPLLLPRRVSGAANPV